jgi:hypothetical protein
MHASQGRCEGAKGSRRDRGATACLGWILAVVFAFAALARADDFDRWYTIDMAGGRAGWCHAWQKTESDRIVSGNQVAFKLGRAEQAVGVGLEGEFVETKDGKPLSMKTVMRLGNQPTTMDCRYDTAAKSMHIKVTQAGQTNEQDKPMPEGQWLTPAAAGEFVRQRLLAKAEKIEVRTVDPAGGLDPLAALEPALITHKDMHRETIQALGKPLDVVRCITTTSTQAGVESTEYLDDHGVVVRSETRLGGIAMTMMAATREEAKADRPGPEMMTSTFVKPDKPINDARSTKHAVYLVSTPEAKLPAFPATGAQRVTPSGEWAARVEVDLEHPAPAPERDATDASFTRASATVNSDDEQVRKLAQAAVKDAGESKAGRAEALRRWVHGYITDKDLGVGFASATETVRTRRGDCTEHGVLLAAALRAVGIPSRVVCGLIYAEGFAGSRNIFGYHMWAQALLEIDGKPTWVDLDATLGPATPFDATHIALATSALADGQTQDALLTIATIIGRLQIKVESVE